MSIDVSQERIFTFSFSKNLSAGKRSWDALVQALSKNLIDDALSLADFSYDLANTINQRSWEEGLKPNPPESNKEAMVAYAAIDYWIFNVRHLWNLMIQVEKKNGLKCADKKMHRVYGEVARDGIEFFAKKMGEVSGEQVSLWSKVIQEKNNSKQEVFQDMPLVCKPEDNAKTSSALNWTMSDVAKTLDCERNVMFLLPIQKSALEGLIALNKSRSDMLLPLLQ
ncbi:MAG: hypothetical protein K8I82_05255 [Anaerolineae bacterium]|nr:hypothetical protein [Anaerolineae bacterium]